MTEVSGQMPLPGTGPAAGSLYNDILVGSQDQRSSGQSGSVLSSLRQSGDLVRQILADVQKIDQVMSSINDKTKSAFGGGSGGGTHSNGMPVPSFGGQSGGGGSGGGIFSPRNIGKDLTAGAIGSFFGSNAPFAAAATSNDLIYNQLRTVATFNGISAGGHGYQVSGLPKQLASMYGQGIFNNADLMGGVSTLMGIGQGPTVLNGQFAQQFSSLSRLTGLGSTATSQIFAGAYQNSFGMARARALGMPLVGPNGQLKNPYDILNNIYQTTGGSSLKHLQADLTPYGSLAMNLKGFLGIDDATVQQLAPLFQAANKAGTGIDPNNPAFKSAMKSLGLDDKTVQSLMDRGSAANLVTATQNAGAQNGIRAANEAAAELSRGFAHLGGAVQDLFGTIRGFLGGASNSPGGGTSPFGNAINTAVNTAVQGYILRGVLGLGGKSAAGGAGGGMFGGGLAGDAAVGATATTSRLAMVGSMGRFARVGYVGAALTALDVLKNADKRAHTDSHGSLTPKNSPWTNAYHLYHDVVGGAGDTLMSVNNTINKWLHYNPPDIGTPKSWAEAGAHDISSAWHSVTGGLGLGASDDHGGGSTTPVNAGSVLNFAQEQLGTPYSWGGGGVNGPSRGINQGRNTVGFDCSSFVQYVFSHYGVQLPRTTYEQVKVGRPVSAQQAMPGDLLFFGSASAPHHVGIYMGNGKMIEAPYTGATIRITSVNPSTASAIRRVITGTGYAVAPSGDGASASPLSGVATQAFGASAMAAGLGLPTVLSGGMPGGQSVPGGNAAAAPTNVSGAVAIGKNMAARMGWTGDQWNALYQLWNRESGWNANAVNKSSGAYGIPQALGHGHPFNLGDAQAQINWGLDYIKSRYGDPEHAWAHEQKIGWYEKGAWKIEHDQLAVIHAGEMVVPKGPAEAIRRDAGGHGTGKVVNLYVQAHGSSHTDAVRLAKMVKRILDEDHDLESLASR